MLQLSEEFSSGGARLRFDVHGSKPREHVLDDLSFLAYRLDVWLTVAGVVGKAVVWGIT